MSFFVLSLYLVLIHHLPPLPSPITTPLPAVPFLPLVDPTFCFLMLIKLTSVSPPLRSFSFLS